MAEGQTLNQKVERFRDLATQLTSASSGEASQAQCDTACRFVEALLLGVAKHLPQVRIEVEILTASGSAPLEWPAGVQGPLVSLVARLTPGPIIGEMATRSRLPLDVWIDGELRFALQPPQKEPCGSPLVLFTSGLQMRALPDAIPLRQQMKAALGNGYDLASAYDWWQTHKEQFPLKTSKLRRVVESFFSQKAKHVTPAVKLHTALWGFTQIDVGIEWTAFEFHINRTGPSPWVTVTASFYDLPSIEDDAEVLRKTEWTLKQMANLTNRKLGETFATSAAHYARMKVDSALGFPGANADKIVKLFSAADWWGPGEDGWSQWDDTWLCTDKKDAFGRMVVEQGRVLWRLASDTQVHSQSQTADCSHHVPPRIFVGVTWVPAVCFASFLLLLVAYFVDRLSL